MTANISTVLDATRILGLRKDASLQEAKSAFRDIAKRLHPDHTAATPETLSLLADAIAAIRYLETANPVFFTITLTTREAHEGTLRALRKDGRSGVFKIPPGCVDGARLEAVGDASLIACIRIEGREEIRPRPNTALSGFTDDFVKTSPTARFANWLRKSRSAA